jgi:hypothetical protein
VPIRCAVSNAPSGPPGAAGVSDIPSLHFTSTTHSAKGAQITSVFFARRACPTSERSYRVRVTLAFLGCTIERESIVPPKGRSICDRDMEGS